MPRTDFARKKRIGKQSEYGNQRNKFFWAHKHIHTMTLLELENAMRSMEQREGNALVIRNPRWMVAYRQWQRLRAAEEGSTVEAMFGQPVTNSSAIPVIDEAADIRVPIDFTDEYGETDDSTEWS